MTEYFNKWVYDSHYNKSFGKTLDKGILLIIISDVVILGLHYFMINSQRINYNVRTYVCSKLIFFLFYGNDSTYFLNICLDKPTTCISG